MEENVSNVSSQGLRALARCNPSEMMNRLAVWRESHPDITDYVIHSDEEANNLLIVMGAILTDQAPHEPDHNVRKSMIEASKDARKAVIECRALSYLTDLTAEADLTINGLNILVGKVVLQ